MTSVKFNITKPLGNIRILNYYINPPTTVIIPNHDAKEFERRLKVLGFKYEIISSKPKKESGASKTDGNNTNSADQNSTKTETNTEGSNTKNPKSTNKKSNKSTNSQKNKNVK